MKHFALWVILLSMPLRSVTRRSNSSPSWCVRSRLQRASARGYGLVRTEYCFHQRNSGQAGGNPCAVVSGRATRGGGGALAGGSGLTVHRDKIGNVIGELRGTMKKKLCWWLRTWTPFFPRARTSKCGVTAADERAGDFR